MYIYKITNELNKKIYIGLSTKHSDISQDYYGSGILITKALIKHGKENFNKIILENDIANIDELNLREIYWINFYNSTDSNIGYNISKGGKGSLGTVKSEETIEKLRIASTGKKQSPETIAKRVSKIKGLKRTIETCEKISLYYKQKFSDITKHPMYGKTNTHSEETKKKISESNTGKKCTEETKKKISESNIGKKCTEETKKKMSLSKKGKKLHSLSEETKQKMRESHKGKISGGIDIECPSCKKIGSSNAMKRWHFDNCKSIKNAY